MEEIAMLVFWLPIIIFEAMLANLNERKAGDPTAIDGAARVALRDV
ncbi:hypothetical protein QA640_44580 (plasmid) [Bradyrhizobium sp. CB82]|nr:hypothetical protein [Bradyrhizobium sp. CB82]WFU45888.1 hypothetical protein QA640_44580 [Bradyrhizobium sp. CB82]